MPAPGDSTTAAALKVTSSPATAAPLSTERAVVVDAFCTETVLVPWMPSCVAVIAAGPPGETAHTFPEALTPARDRKSTRLNSSHEWSSYAVFCLKKKNIYALTSVTSH